MSPGRKQAPTCPRHWATSRTPVLSCPSRCTAAGSAAFDSKSYRIRVARRCRGGGKIPRETAIMTTCGFQRRCTLRPGSPPFSGPCLRMMAMREGGWDPPRKSSTIAWSTIASSLPACAWLELRAARRNRCQSSSCPSARRPEVRSSSFQQGVGRSPRLGVGGARFLAAHTPYATKLCCGGDPDKARVRRPAEPGGRFRVHCDVDVVNDMPFTTLLSAQIAEW